MSQKDALAFLSKVSEDQELMNKVNAADPAAWDEVARAAGFDVTKEELTAASNTITAKFREEGGSLSEEDLAKVAGGVSTMTSTYPTYVSYQGLKFNSTNLGKIDAFKVAAW